MKIYVITLFPEYFEVFKKQGVLSRLFDNEHTLEILSLRGFGIGSRKTTDSKSAGGLGMTLRADVLEKALLSIPSYDKVVCLAPRGLPWNQSLAKILSDDLQKKNYVFIVGRYQGIDERFLEKYVQEYYSLGDFILSGGEIALMAMLDSSLRLMKKAINNENSLKNESFSKYLQGPTYTKPLYCCGQEIPEVLLSGHHENIVKFHDKNALKMTQKYRKDLL
jgi:tRNA (guanine37-N1)-methyltransferase